MRFLHAAVTSRSITTLVVNNDRTGCSSFHVIIEEIVGECQFLALACLGHLCTAEQASATPVHTTYVSNQGSFSFFLPAFQEAVQVATVGPVARDQ